jgi:hypothetical protein
MAGNQVPETLAWSSPCLTPTYNDRLQCLCWGHQHHLKCPWEKKAEKENMTDFSFPSLSDRELMLFWPNPNSVHCATK